MNINFEYDGVTASESLEKFTEEKLKNLHQKYDMIIRADVFFKTENTKSDKTGMICNIRLSVPGPRLFAEGNHNKFRTSVQESVSDLEKQLRKKKEKMMNY